MVRLELNSPTENKGYHFEVQERNNSKAGTSPNLTGISTVILFDDDKVDPITNIQFGTMNYNEFKKRNHSPNKKGKEQMVYDWDEVDPENHANISNFKRSYHQVTHILEVYSIITEINSHMKFSVLYVVVSNLIDAWFADDHQ